MAILPDFMIRERMVGEVGERRILMPWSERAVQNGMSFGLSCAGYDVRTKQGITLAPSQFALLSTVEHFHMPADLIATVKDKSTWARRGLSVFNTVIEPGWRGWLTIEAVNHSSIDIVIKPGDPIAQIIFEGMAAPAERAYAGKYQDQANEPVAAMRETTAA